MDRRKFVSALGLGLGGLALAGCEQKDCPPVDGQAAAGAEPEKKKPEQQTYEWKMVTTWPKNYPGLGAGANRFAKRVEEMSAGRIKIKVYGAKELVPAFEVFDAVRQGSAEMGHGAAYYWKGKHPATPFFTAVPFGLTAQEMNGWLHHGGGQKLWDDLYAQFNLKPFACGNTGTQMAGWFNKEINSVEDLKGLRLRTPSPAVSEMLSFLGADPQGLPPGEVYESLQRGVINGTVFPWDPVRSFGLNEVLKYHLDLGAYTVSFFFVMNERSYSRLSPDAQACVDKYSGADLVAKFGGWWDSWDAPAREDAVEAGHEITKLSKEERALWEEALQPMMQSYIQSVADQGVDNAEEIVQAMRDKVAEYDAAKTE